MCNIYKNNLILLTNLNDNKDLYYIDNTLHIEDRYLNSVRGGKSIKKINNIINNSYLQVCNNFILDLDSDDDCDSIETAIDSLDDTYNILEKSLIGFDKYIDYLNDFSDQETIELLNNTAKNLENIFRNIEVSKNEYINNYYIKTDSESDSEDEDCMKFNYLSSLYNNNMLYNDLEDSIPKEETSNNDYVYGLFTILGRKLGGFIFSVMYHLKILFPFN